jgi:hypothetical protein
VLGVLGRGLRDEFPNPERIGCPGREIVAAIAAHKMPLSQAESYLDHLTSCSPCYRDFLQLQREHRQRRTRMIFAVAASVLIVAAIATWAAIRGHDNVQVAQSVVVDLRNRSLTRGTDSMPSEPPLEISRNASRLDIYLPLGSGDGPYDLRVSTANGEALLTREAVAKIEQGITSLRVDVSLSTASPGLYVLELRKAGSEWNSYPLRIQ